MNAFYSSPYNASYKTKPCFHFQRGDCRHGDSCRYRHDNPEDTLPWKTASSAGNQSSHGRDTPGSPKEIDPSDMEMFLQFKAFMKTANQSKTVAPQTSSKGRFGTGVDKYTSQEQTPFSPWSSVRSQPSSQVKASETASSESDVSDSDSDAIEDPLRSPVEERDSTEKYMTDVEDTEDAGVNNPGFMEEADDELGTVVLSQTSTSPSKGKQYKDVAPPPDIGAEAANAWLISLIVQGKPIGDFLDHLRPPVCSEILSGNVAKKNAAICEAVSHNHLSAIRQLIVRGANVNLMAECRSQDDEFRIPLLAFAIAGDHAPETTEVVKALLAGGARPDCIPEALYRDPGSPMPVDDGSRLPPSDWCNALWYNRLKARLNVSQRYFLLRASTTKAKTARQTAELQHLGLTNLTFAKFLLVGQDYVIDRLVKDFIVWRRTDANQTLVMLFAAASLGPSGHGKTFLAEKVGSLLGLESISVDGSSLYHATDISGSFSGGGFRADKGGSPLNEFLYKESGKASVVVLDEFEKTGESARNALSSMFSTGQYVCRVHNSIVDLRSTVWILTTNVVDPIVTSFSEHFQDKFVNGQPTNSQMEELRKSIQDDTRRVFGPAMAGRITKFLPFIPFNEIERRVIASECFLAMKRMLVQSPVKKSDPRAPIYVQLEDELRVLGEIASNHYDPHSGARSIDQEVREKLQVEVMQEYLECPDTPPMNGRGEKYLISMDKEDVLSVSRVTD
ncbi:hypothetical protein SISNIDRAFT_470291 [Sistotremastrum niveocremeum HHB9708]|uniref:C3H1-type domain-containing protein n=1 Tax=Sistotremastrum niveocremeum HHB9708 TaxID=1314777 RepID=A0A164P2P9_9AGAM|nr:hypothetical protein SISNIDRAFT_470291 [Sistotremastrum niveocremeum HHB9708]